VRRPLAIEALIIVRPGRFAPADIGIFLALRRQYRLVARVRRADAGWLLRCGVRRHAAIIPGAARAGAVRPRHLLIRPAVHMPASRCPDGAASSSAEAGRLAGRFEH
jgi:hypothetical protein